MVEVGGGDPGRRLRWQAELELVDQELEFGLGMGVAGEADLATVGGRQMHIDHLNGGELFERAARSEPGRQSMKPARQSDLHAISQERNKGVSPILH